MNKDILSVGAAEQYGWLMGKPSGEIDPQAVAVALFSADIRLSQDGRLDFFKEIDVDLLAQLGSVASPELLRSEKKSLLKWRWRALNLIGMSLAGEAVFDKAEGKRELPQSDYWTQIGLADELQVKLKGIPHQVIVIGSAAKKTASNNVQVKDIDLVIAVQGGEKEHIRTYEQLALLKKWSGIPVSCIITRPGDLSIYHAMSPNASFDPENAVVLSNTTAKKIAFYPRTLAWRAKLGRLRVQLDLVRTLQGERDTYTNEDMKRRLKKRAMFGAMMVDKEEREFIVEDDWSVEEVRLATAGFLASLLQKDENN